ncbi:HDOD domain-containing protein [Deefgea rivuli]|uniref:HDOD domain-containing protein n=1 Tax=Deefgea rivuli TaxID=400948 RepID=UPI000684741E|nr:HDOD domain-containing protein [Deefgea rivuli]
MILLELVWDQQQRWIGLFAHNADQFGDILGAALLNQPLRGVACYALGQHSTEGLVNVQQDEHGIVLPNSARLHFQLQHSSDFTALNPLDVACGPWYTEASPTANAANPSKPVLLELLSLIVSDAETSALEMTLAKAPQLMFNLLKLVNSVSMGSAAPARSIRQAITLLGRRQLQRWLQLLLYAEQYGEATPAILIAAALRGKRLALWAEHGWLGNTNQDEAFLCGMLSLLDRLFAEPLTELMALLPLDLHLRSALLSGEGVLGLALKQLTALEAGERHNPLIAPLLAKQAAWVNCELKAIAWAHRLICESH